MSAHGKKMSIVRSKKFLASHLHHKCLCGMWTVLLSLNSEAAKYSCRPFSKFRTPNEHTLHTYYVRTTYTYSRYFCLPVPPLDWLTDWLTDWLLVSFCWLTKYARLRRWDFFQVFPPIFWPNSFTLVLTNSKCASTRSVFDTPLHWK